MFCTDALENVFFVDLWRETYEANELSFTKGQMITVFSFYDAIKNNSPYEGTIFGHDTNRELRRIAVIVIQDKNAIFDKMQSFPQYMYGFMAHQFQKEWFKLK